MGQDENVQEGYVKLETDDKLRTGDEYKTGSSDWRLVPPLLFGDRIPEGPTQWRRPVEKAKENKKWWQLFS